MNQIISIFNYRFRAMNQQFLDHHASIEEDVKRQFASFIKFYFEVRKDQIENLLSSDRKLIVIDSQSFWKFNHELALEIFEHYYKYEGVMNQVFSQYVNEREDRPRYAQKDIRNQQDTMQKFQVTFNKGLGGSYCGLRDLNSNKLGKLIALKGTVTRTTEVRPELLSGVFRCTVCKAFTKKIIQQFRYTEPKKCSYDRCDSSTFELFNNKSQFADFQKLRVQEEPGSIPAGGMPRSIDIILRDDNVEKGQPGDVCKFIGYLCVVPQMESMLKPGQKTKLSTLNMNTRGRLPEIDGVKGVKGFRQLNYRYIFIAKNVVVENNQFNEEIELSAEDQEEQNAKKELLDNDDKPNFTQQSIYDKISKNLTQSEISMVSSISKNKNLINDVAQSMFPSIFGHKQIKQALLLQLLGGIHKVTGNKINIRGDINILIVGDPSTAKSQFLKCINKFVPRSVYTNGKTTSAAGLTASVARDQNGNVSIEAGALMLADNGICCIDQFDKMDSKDQTAIHQAMQQQTISIAKAGVHATLNARASILAAANPLYGRYDKSKSLKSNLNLSAPIMSRFDLYFIICDEANAQVDHKLCDFLIGMHRNTGANNSSQNQKYDKKTLMLYISLAKKLHPMLTIEAAQQLRLCYESLRCNDFNSDILSYRPTVRQLQSLIRLSEAYARLHFCLHITREHVKQVYQLIRKSIIILQKSVQIDEEDEAGPQANQPEVHLIEKGKRKEKKKTIELSYEHFSKIRKSLENLFKQYQMAQKKNNVDSQIKLTQLNVINYIIAQDLQGNETLNSSSSFEQYKKIAKSLVKKFINDERVLMVAQDHPDEDQRLLSIHPNYKFDR